MDSRTPDLDGQQVRNYLDYVGELLRENIDVRPQYRVDPPNSITAHQWVLQQDHLRRKTRQIGNFQARARFLPAERTFSGNPPRRGGPTNRSDPSRA